jgi:hypothetical protein
MSRIVPGKYMEMPYIAHATGFEICSNMMLA